MGGIRRCWWLAVLAVAAGCQGKGTVSGPAPAGPGGGSGAPPTAGPTGGPGSDFTLNTLDGKTLRLSDYRGKPAVVNFWGSWCGYCRQEAPGLEAVYKKYQARGFTIIGVAVHDNQEDVRAAIKELGLTFPVGLSDEIAQAYGVNGYPTNFFIDKTGRIAHQHAGAMSEEDFEAAVLKLL